MLFILIPIIWLAIAAFVVILCRGAASADATLLASVEQVGPRVTRGMSDDPHSGARRRTWRAPGARRHDASPAPIAGAQSFTYGYRSKESKR
jgi:hypothetical protein